MTEIPEHLRKRAEAATRWAERQEEYKVKLPRMVDANVVEQMAAVERERRITELVEALEGCNVYDPEVGHMRADVLLLKFIGDDRVSDAFDAVRKWYA